MRWPRWYRTLPQPARWTVAGALPLAGVGIIYGIVESVTDYPVLVPPGAYRLVMDSDEPRFGGQGRIQPGQTFELLTEMRGNELCTVIKVYLPCRTAMVLERGLA